jgi:hypothetical protein
LRVPRRPVRTASDAPVPVEQPLEFLKVAGFSVAAAVGYGIVHDQVTAHLCVEYFSVAHPPVFGTDDPFVLALGWGVLATWWVGLPLGIVLGLVARAGRPPRLAFATLRRPILTLLLAMGACALVAGLAGAALAANGTIDPARAYVPAIAPEKRVAFAADACAHLASYASALAGGVVVIGWAAARRRRDGLRSGPARAVRG